MMKARKRKKKMRATTTHEQTSNEIKSHVRVQVRVLSCTMKAHFLERPELNALNNALSALCSFVSQ